MEKSCFERLRAFIHKKPIGERITQHRVLLTFLFFFWFIGGEMLADYVDRRSEAIQVAGHQAQVVVSGLLQATGERQEATVDAPVFRDRKCTVRVVVPFDRSKADAGMVMSFYDEKLKADGWSLVRLPRNAERMADGASVLYQRGDRESITVSMGDDESSVLFVVVVNAFSYEFFWNIFFIGYMSFCCLLMMAVIWGWRLDKYLR